MPLRVSKAYLKEAESLRGNAGQLAAYDSTANCVVLAGPGSGKTKTLVLKLARILGEDVRAPRGVACITYSNECARELNRRLEPLGLRDAENLFVGTVHGFCLRHVLAPYARLARLPLPIPLKLATSPQTKKAFVVEAERVLGVQQPYKIEDASKYRRRYLDRRDAAWNTDEDLRKVCEAYEARLRKDGLIDFDDLVVSGNELIREHDWVLPVLAARFPVLIVDEYQDLGPALDNIVRRLTLDAGVRLFAVGDPDQSVYGFNGADSDMLHRLSELPEIEDVVSLQLNYRSGAKIVAASQLVLGKNRGYISADKTRPAEIHFVKRPEGLEGQAQHALERILPKVLSEREGRSLGDIAILYRTANIGDVVAEKAIEAGLEFVRIDNAAPYKKVGLTSWIEDCASWCSGGWRISKPQLRGLIGRFLGFRTKQASIQVERKARRDLVRLLLQHRDGDESAVQFIHRIDLELIRPLVEVEASLADQYEQVGRMDKAFSPGGPLGGRSLASLGGRDGSPNQLNLLTMHSAKGCEYDVVIMIGMDQGAMPWTNETPEQLSESRRLLYVGLTRARNAVYLMYSGWVDGKYGPRQLGPSMFLQELHKRMRDAESSNN